MATPYGAVSYVLPTTSNLPTDSLTAYPATGESARTASARPSRRAVSAASSSLTATLFGAGRPASLHRSTRVPRPVSPEERGVISSAWVVPFWTAIRRPHSDRPLGESFSGLPCLTIRLVPAEK